MVQVLTMPMMGNTMEIGIVVEWKVAEGDDVSEGDPVVIVESEKASTEVAAGQDGVLHSLEIGEGEEVPPGTRLGVIRGHDEDEADVEAAIEESDEKEQVTGEPSTEADEGAVTPDEAPSKEDGATDPTDDEDGRIPAAPGARRRAGEEDLPLSEVEGTGPEGAVLIADLEEHLETGRPSDATEVEVPAGTEDGHVAAPPSVRRLARELGVRLSEVQTSGDGDRLAESDVRRAASAESIPEAGPSTAAGQPDVSGEAADPAAQGLTVVDRRQLSGMRATIARRMGQSAREKPHVTLNRAVSADRALAVADEFDDSEPGIGLTDILICAVCEALAEHPEFNAWYGDGQVSLIEEKNIGVAVDIDDGLVTAVLRDVGRKTPTVIAEKRAERTATVQSGEFSLDDIQGGTFTITNLGMFGVDSFDPIINPPEIAILGVGRIRDADDGRELTLSLSFDHRVVDGADAARFLDSIARWFTAPSRLLTQRVEAALE